MRRLARRVLTIPPSGSEPASSQRPTTPPARPGLHSDIRMRSAAPSPTRESTPARDPHARLDDVADLEALLVRAMKARNGAAALVLASRLVYVDPGHEVAQRIKSRCTQRIGAQRTREFPRPDAVPRMVVTWHELKQRPLTREAAYLLTCIDGKATVEQIVDTSALPLLIAYEAFDGLVSDGIVALG